MQLQRPMRVVFFGSGSFGLPTLERLVGDAERYTVPLVVSQPDRPAGRGRKLKPTPVAQWADEHGLARLAPGDVNDPQVVSKVRSSRPEALVVIAFGQKIGPSLLDGVLAVNLHGSLLPAYRGAAPIQRAMMDGCTETGLSVITLAPRMDAGDILAAESTAIRPDETAGELHDRLALLGPALVARVLDEHRCGTLQRRHQDDSLATSAPRLRKEEGTTTFDMAASRVRARIHGLTPWPGCRVLLDGAPVRLLRVRDHPEEASGAAPGTVLDNLHLVCAPGAIEVIEIQSEGGRAMTLDAYRRGRPFEPRMLASPVTSGIS